MKIENTQKISTIKMTKVIHNFCPLGDDWYTNNLELIMVPGQYIPDYLDIDKSVNELEGQFLIIEDVVNAITKILEEYKPLNIVVKSVVNDATHLPVEVIKCEYLNPDEDTYYAE